MDTDLKNEIAENLAAFANYNMVRIREALRYFSDPALEIFLKIPYLLHINTKDHPGYIETKSHPHGIVNFNKSGFYKEAVTRQLFPKSIIEMSPPKTPAIIGLYHIGSLGTLTQSMGSDFDYWVIIDKRKFSAKRYEELEKKLAAIVRFARDSYAQKTSFFIMDQRSIRKNNYASYLGQETLTAPKIFLKEEFYRTILMIAGKIPLWSILPEKIAADSSGRSDALIASIMSMHDELIDLGHIHTVPVEDVLKGLLWHICKSKNDPVKALIKATMVFSHGFGGADFSKLLCEHVKQGYSNAGIDDYGVDPYKALFDQILEFHKQKDPKGINLIKNAIFFRLCGYPFIQVPQENSPKRLLLEKYIRLWNLNKTQVSKLLSYTSWSESEKLVLEKSIVSRLAQMYNLASKKAGEIDRGLKVSEKRNWAILRNKTKERLQKSENKIDECSFFLRQQKIKKLIIHQSLVSGNKEYPYNFSLDLQLVDNTTLSGVYKKSSLLSLFGWIMENSLYKRSTASINFQSSQKLYQSSDKECDLDSLYMSLTPFKPLSDDVFETSAKLSKMVILLVYKKQKMLSVDLLISNTWGELYFDHIQFHGTESVQDLSKRIAMQMHLYPCADTHHVFYQLSDTRNPDIVYQIKKAYSDLYDADKQIKKEQNRPYLDKL